MTVVSHNICLCVLKPTEQEMLFNEHAQLLSLREDDRAWQEIGVGNVLIVLNIFTNVYRVAMHEVGTFELLASVLYGEQWRCPQEVTVHQCYLWTASVSRIAVTNVTHARRTVH